MGDRDGNILEILRLKGYSLDKSRNQNGNTVHLFIPGGYWQAMSRYKYRSLATHLSSQNEENMFLLIGYSHAKTNSNIFQMIETVTKGIGLAIEKLPNYCTLQISGHSAGAHLLFMALTEIPDVSRISKVNLFSGIYDCRPLVSTTINDPINWDQSTAWS